MNPEIARDLLNEAINAAADGDRKYFAEYELPRGGWLQITWDAINMSYPVDYDPAELLAPLDVADLVQLDDWKPNLYVTLSHGADDLDRLAGFVAVFVDLVEKVRVIIAEVNEEA